jgi:outer membrane cobalamin receptor
MYLAVDNLFDENYQQFVGFPAPGITPRAGVRLTF